MLKTDPVRRQTRFDIKDYLPLYLQVFRLVNGAHSECRIKD